MSALVLALPVASATSPASFRVRRDPAVWGEIGRSHVNVAQERRTPSPALLAYARLAADLDVDPREHVLGRGDDDLAPVLRWLPPADEAHAAGRAALEADVRALVDRFRARWDPARLRVKLHPVHHGQCRKFHTDYVALRLLCTYAGPGTEWAPDHAVERAELGRYDDDVALANERIVPDRSRVRRAGLGDVLLLRGQAWRPGAAGAVHRSPPVERCEEHRLVLVLTMVERG